MAQTQLNQTDGGNTKLDTTIYDVTARENKYIHKHITKQRKTRLKSLFREMDEMNMESLKKSGAYFICHRSF